MVEVGVGVGVGGSRRGGKGEGRGRRGYISQVLSFCALYILFCIIRNVVELFILSQVLLER